MKGFVYRIYMVMVAIMVVTVAYAESHYVPHISVGIHGGMGASNVAFTPSIPQKFQLGPTGGVSLRYAEERLVGILAEVNYEQRGWSEEFEDSPLQYTRSLSYISMPIMTHIYFGSKRAKCFFNLGPEFSWLIGQKTISNFDYTNPYGADGWPEENRMTEQLTTEVNNKFDYGICAGTGFEFYLRPRTSIYLEIRYYFGLGNIFPATKADTFSASRNSSLALTFGYNFRLK